MQLSKRPAAPVSPYAPWHNVKRPVFELQNGTFGNVLGIRRLGKASFTATVNIKMLTSAWPIGYTGRIGLLQVFILFNLCIALSLAIPCNTF